MNIPGTIGAYPTFDPPTLPCELYAEALERAEKSLAELKGMPAPVFPAAALKATDCIWRAAKELCYAALCLQDAERLEREDEP